jgi:transposase
VQQAKHRASFSRGAGPAILALGGDQATEVANSTLDVPAPEQPEQVDAPAPVEPEAANEPSKTEQGPQANKKKRKRVRSMKVDPSKVERKEERATIPAEERCCALCGGDKKVFGTTEHELFVFIPARIEVRAEVREKWSCPTCRKDVSVAPRSSTPDVERKVDASLLAKLVRDKCALGLPLDPRMPGPAHMVWPARPRLATLPLQYGRPSQRSACAYARRHSRRRAPSATRKRSRQGQQGAVLSVVARDCHRLAPCRRRRRRR